MEKDTIISSLYLPLRESVVSHLESVLWDTSSFSESPALVKRQFSHNCRITVPGFFAGPLQNTVHYGGVKGCPGQGPAKK